ncbi:unnamed protein product [Caenorhabditis auriculariae]|uniref:Uncharacterized protein n=1 Tax=Caenorhabditis auriculariae TaxID=2777116 RepID=A0A8S1HST6_9PELO|nr:unnamed protein product [Caenorhabditis auriculariae]
MGIEWYREQFDQLTSSSGVVPSAPCLEEDDDVIKTPPVPPRKEKWAYPEPLPRLTICRLLTKRSNHNPVLTLSLRLSLGLSLSPSLSLSLSLRLSLKLNLNLNLSVQLKLKLNPHPRASSSRPVKTKTTTAFMSYPNKLNLPKFAELSTFNRVQINEPNLPKHDGEGRLCSDVFYCF